MHKYLYFIEDYAAINNTYIWYKGVRYAIQKSDNNNYYIFKNNLQLYPIPKDLEFTVYTVEEFSQDKIK